MVLSIPKVIDRVYLDLKASIDSLGYEAKNNTVYQLILDYDADGAGTIEFEDFLHLMSSTVTEQDSRD